MRLVITGLLLLVLVAVTPTHQVLSHEFDTASAMPDDSPTPEPSPTPTPDPEIVKAEKEKALADARKAKADAEKAAADAEAAATASKLAAQRAKLGLGAEPASAPSPPSGSISTSEGFKFIETQILAEASARAAAFQVVEQLCGSINGRPVPSPVPTPIRALTAKPLRTLVINSGTDRSSVEKYRAILAQLDFLKDEYARLIDQAKDARLNMPEAAEGPEFAPALLIPAATELVSSAAGLINLFRTDTEFKDQAVTVNTRMIVSLITNDLLNTSNAQCKVDAIFHPAVYPIGVGPNAGSGLLLTAYRGLLSKTTEGDEEVRKDNEKVEELKAKVKKLDEEIAELKKKIAAEKAKKSGKKKNKKEPTIDLAAVTEELAAKEADRFVIANKIKAVTEAAAAIQTFKTSLADVRTLLTSVDDATKLPVLTALIRAERLSDILKNEHTYVLDLDVKAAGTNRTRKNIIWNARIAHSAGVSIDASLYNNRDEQVFAILRPFYIEFSSSKQIRKHSGFQTLNQIKP
ncbi:MAG TPA: hypothetical protein VIT88_00640 [Pyrinomonadaceae bacterium]